MADLHGTDCVSEDSASDYTLVLGKIQTLDRGKPYIWNTSMGSNEMTRPFIVQSLSNTGSMIVYAERSTDTTSLFGKKPTFVDWYKSVSAIYQ